MKRSYWPTLIIFLLSFIWGSTWVAIQFGLESLPPFLFATARFVIAAVLVYVAMVIQRIPFPKDRHTWKVMIVIGIYQALDYAFVFWGEQYVNAGIGAILFATMPFFVVIFNYFMSERHEMSWVQIAGITISFIGVIFIFADDFSFTDKSILGGICMILAAMSGAYMSVYAKLHANHINPVTNTFVQMLVSALSLGILGLVFEDMHRFQLTVNAALAILYLAVFGSALAFILYMWVIKKVSVIEASIIPLTTPIAAVVLGWLMRNEEFGPNVFFGGALILIGLYMVNVLAARLAAKGGRPPVGVLPTAEP
ncbi:EamA family transporter [bacterium]|nr:EamA family transporter [bacterium]